MTGNCLNMGFWHTLQVRLYGLLAHLLKYGIFACHIQKKRNAFLLLIIVTYAITGLNTLLRRGLCDKSYSKLSSF
jgi:hypothetical protein